MALKEVEKAYLSGFFDGEGCVVFRVTPTQTQCRLSLTNLDPYVCYLFKNQLGGNVHQIGVTKTNRTIYSWSVNGKASEAAARVLIQHCLYKKAQLKLFIEAREECFAKRLARMDEEQLRVRLQYFDKITQLKRQSDDSV